jgi:hypothetical protein
LRGLADATLNWRTDGMVTSFETAALTLQLVCEGPADVNSM